MSRRRACEATGFACVARVNGSVQFIFTVFGILGLYEMYVDVGITRDDGVDWCYGPKWRGRGSACAQLGALAGRAVGSREGARGGRAAAPVTFIQVVLSAVGRMKSSIGVSMGAVGTRFLA